VKLIASLMTACVITLFCWAGCTTEESPQPPAEKHSVVMPIKKSSRLEPSAQEEKETEVAPAAAVEDHHPGHPATDIEDEASPQPEEPGYYIVKEGESLSAVAARDEVYGDSLKWPILYFYNREKIGELQLVDGFLERELPQGERLKVITEDEVRENLRQRAEHTYVVNVLSTRTQKRLIPTAIRLMREDYPVYLTTAVVKGKTWVRLRVGFFSTRIEAELERQKIIDLLGIRDSWVAKIKEEEFEEFAGY
jgi:hypothetical protein